METSKNINSIFNEVGDKIDELKSDLMTTSNQTYTDMRELEKVKEALKDYLHHQIDISQQLLRNLGDYY